MFLQLFINGIITGSIYAVAALGFAFVYNTTKVFHIAYAALYALAPYFTYWLFVNLRFPLWFAFLISLIFTAIVSVFIEKFVYQPLVKKESSLNVFLISSIGVMIIIVNLIAMIFNNETKMLNNNISNTFFWNNIIITHTQVIQFIISAFVIFLSFVLLIKTKFGLKARALRDNSVLYKVLGHNPANIRLFIFTISGLLVAIAANLNAYDIGMDPYVGMPILLTSVVALIIGGTGNFFAPVLGAFIIGIIEAVTVYFFSSQWQAAVVFFILIIFLLFRPQGILGLKQRNI